MSITIYTYNDKVLKNATTDKWLRAPDVDPYNPLGLPANTIRCKFNNPSYTPSVGTSQTLIEQGDNYSIWDIYISSNNWSDRFRQITSLTEVLGANTTNVTDIEGIFYRCSNLTNIALFDTSNVTSMMYFCYEVESLTAIPLFNTSKVQYMGNAFARCYNVAGGALALYQQASTQTTPPSNHNDTFLECGIYTQTGTSELYQIPSSWGGYA